MKNLLTRFLNDESGATAAEYGLIVTVLSIGIMASATVMGDDVVGTLNTLSNEISAS